MRYLGVVLILGVVLLSGCRGKEDMFARIEIPPAGKGAPQFDPKELIHQDEVKREAKYEIAQEALQSLPADKLVNEAWSALGAGALDTAIEISNTILTRFYAKAQEEQRSLGGKFPQTGKEKDYPELNACGAALYIVAEAYEKKGDCQKAIEYYRRAIKEFPLAQNWDPRGWYWKVAEEAKGKIEKLEQSCEK